MIYYKIFYKKFIWNTNFSNLERLDGKSTKIHYSIDDFYCGFNLSFYKEYLKNSHRLYKINNQHNDKI